MREVFTKELEALADGLVDLGNLAVEAIKQSNKALTTNDLQLAEQVITDDAQVNANQVEIDRRAVEILALQAPVAADLRIVVAALKMSVALERMGDLARHISALVRIRYPEHAIPEAFERIFTRMGSVAERIGEGMVELLSTPGLAAVPMISALDEELDALHLEVFTVIASLSADQITPSQIADVTLLARYYERFGDQAVNVAQRVDYMLSGNLDSDASSAE